MGIRSYLSLLVAIATVLLCGSIWSAAEAVDNSSVFHLTSQNFDKHVGEPGSIWVLDFYAPWCGHCQKLKPELEKAASQLATDRKLNNVRMAMVDCTVNSDICDRFNVKGYPTLFTYREGVSSPYRGPRSSAALIAHSRLAVVPPVRPFKSTKVVGDDLLAAYNSGSLAGAAFIFLGGPGVHMKAFQRAAAKSAGEALFYAPGGTWHPDRIQHGLQNEDMYKTIGKQVGVELYSPEEYGPIITALKQLVSVSNVLTLSNLDVPEGTFFVPDSIETDTEKQIIRNIFNEMPLVVAFVPSTSPVLLHLKNTPVTDQEDSPILANFISENKFPLISPLNGYNFGDMLQGKNGGRVGILFAAKDAGVNEIRAFLPLAAKYRSRALFSYLNAGEYPGFFRQYNIEEKDLPTMIVVDYLNDEYYVPELALATGVPLQTVEEYSSFLASVFGEENDGDNKSVKIHAKAPARALSPWWKFAKVTRSVEKLVLDMLAAFEGNSDLQSAYISIAAIISFTLFVVFMILYLLGANEVIDPEIERSRQEAKAQGKKSVAKGAEKATVTAGENKTETPAIPSDSASASSSTIIRRRGGAKK